MTDQDQILKKIKSNPGIKQSVIGTNSRQIRQLVKKGLITRVLVERGEGNGSGYGGFALYPAEN